ncbi:helix-turn-helix domain-containing protein [Agrobacterium tumefaciens]|uniref:helix-turn-helix domain-containing protein n=1 Tax=Agrobacterium tumefaciens TaxID=358 RepID=UPI0021D2514F|nr:helix-turn-helix domain-containing protein [Agrobacterium tumefaciens]UXT48817.1 helix-turn-helix domain-containing protein [Agrobacterium tumefaciens]
MDDLIQQRAAQQYAKTTIPLDESKGWQREDIQLAFIAGIRAQAIRRLLTTKEVAEVLSASVSTIRDLARSGELAYIHIGRGTERSHMVFSPDEVESFITRNARRDFIGSRIAGVADRKKRPRSAHKPTTEDDDFLAQRLRRIEERKKRNV